ncbi:hypothetical protein KFK09_028306 [Dendrobium nobile]|uniref:Uncharacterized protein n=1 Tax=Dendrobium nobile TaxID=94219 RepID=A0A8T3A729_DENNO|nr:hypothetical protein KFK09_028306 [Dendrobium nobile]
MTKVEQRFSALFAATAGFVNFERSQTKMEEPKNRIRMQAMKSNNNGEIEKMKIKLWTPPKE